MPWSTTAKATSPDIAIEARAVREAMAGLPAEDQYVLLRIFYDGASGARSRRRVISSQPPSVAARHARPRSSASKLTA